MPVFAELKRRRVFRAVISYAVAAFAILQIIEPVMHGLHWPDAVLSYVVAALAIGFPLVVGLAWIFDIRGGRVQRTAPSVGSPRASRVFAALAGLAALGAIPALVYLYTLRTPPKPATTVPAAPSIAVLPFVNMSSDKENEYFSEGITEELINALANIEGLRVVSRTAVFALQGKTETIQKIGADLNVQNILEGSVRREGSALRVTAQLINVADGFHLWSKSYDREVKSIFAVEDEIARAIADALQRKLVRSVPATDDVQAHDLYLRGRYFWNKRSADGVRTAADYFERAIRADPDYALAYAGLADALVLQSEYDVAPAADLLPKAKAAAEKALQLEPGLAEAHASLGLVAHFGFDPDTALREYRTALELKPEYAMARKWYADELSILGRLQEARAQFERALKDDPLSPIINFSMSEVQLYDGDLKGAEATLRKVLEMDPAFPPAHMGMVHLYVAQGKFDDALAEVGKLGHSGHNYELLRAFVLARAGRREEATKAALAAERSGKVSPALLGGFWVANGNPDKGIPLLMKGCQELDPGVLMVKVDHAFDSARSDPRFKEVLKCARLE